MALPVIVKVCRKQDASCSSSALWGKKQRSLAMEPTMQDASDVLPMVVGMRRGGEGILQMLPVLENAVISKL